MRPAESRGAPRVGREEQAGIHRLPYAALANPSFRALAEDSRIVGFAPADHAGRRDVPQRQDRVQGGGQDLSHAWHIDYFYWQGTRPKISVWIPFDDVSSENGALTVIRGSHKKEWRPKKGGVDGEFFNEVDGAGWRESDVAVCTVGRGGVVIFSDRLVHGSTANTAKKDRFVIISTYQAPAADEPFDLDFPARKVLVPAG